MEHDDEYAVIEIPKLDADKFGVDVRPDSELITDEGEVNHG